MDSLATTENKLANAWKNGIAQAEGALPGYRQFQEQYGQPVTENHAGWYCLAGGVNGQIDAAAKIIQDNTGAKISTDWDGEGIVYNVVFPSGRWEQHNSMNLPSVAKSLAAGGFKDPGAPTQFPEGWGD